MSSISFSPPSPPPSFLQGATAKCFYSNHFRLLTPICPSWLLLLWKADASQLPWPASLCQISALADWHPQHWPLTFPAKSRGNRVSVLIWSSLNTSFGANFVSVCRIKIGEKTFIPLVRFIFLWPFSLLFYFYLYFLLRWVRKSYHLLFWLLIYFSIFVWKTNKNIKTKSKDVMCPV